MVKFILRRFLYALITLWLIASFTFVLMKNLPGNPLGEGSERIPKATKEMLMKQYGLDKPLWEQYLTFMNNIIHGDLGASYQFPAHKVTDIIKQAFPSSLELGLISIAIAIIAGLTLGIIASLKHNKAGDYTAMFIAILGVSIPSFVLGPLLSYYIGVKWGILPAGLWKGPSYRILPSLALSFGTIAILARLMRTSMLDVLNQDYIKTAKSKGLTNFTVVVKHTIRNAILPVITIIGPIFVNVITGTLVVEQIFSVPGLGKHFVTSVYSNDYTMISGLTIFYSSILILVIFITDVVYGFVDPRIRLGKGGK
ncbi:oligopeptide transport system permease protein [Paenibacillus sp. V4I3]|uniref:ABC transporter permease n=1 Tax=unclassified Paenibacillus TaxID=185978 RepID=UPI0027810BBC|nr:MULTISPECIES: ABC transporter permease [unclassified Paenibacillus]MDQ0876873.1 oligopeptide transport system permease protein [Paenibacillus sp. V4I3]MDQ0887249.1 oligopeptide transport system permease protein [Paenibacillus sp. V4I9]